ncbi:MAG: DUF4239 domain-containing protein [Chthoniobacterales bacterium]
MVALLLEEPTLRISSAGASLEFAMLHLLRLPNAISFLLVALCSGGLAALGLALVRWKFSAKELRENHDVAFAIFGAFGWLYAVVVAFVVFVTWTGYDDANKNLQLEASRALDVFYNAEMFPEPVKSEVQTRLIGYLEYIQRDELPKLADGRATLRSAVLLRDVITIFDRVDMSTITNEPVYTQSLEHIDDLAELRRHRIFAGTNTVPEVIWLVLLFGGLVTVGYTYFFAMTHVSVQYVMTSLLSLTVALILFLIYVLDHPFTGVNRISADPLREAKVIMKDRLASGK